MYDVFLTNDFDNASVESLCHDDRCTWYSFDTPWLLFTAWFCQKKLKSWRTTFHSLRYRRWVIVNHRLLTGFRFRKQWRLLEVKASNIAKKKFHKYFFYIFSTMLFKRFPLNFGSLCSITEVLSKNLCD